MHPSWCNTASLLRQQHCDHAKPRHYSADLIPRRQTTLLSLRTHALLHHHHRVYTTHHPARTRTHAINQDRADSPVGEDRPPGVHLGSTDHVRNNNDQPPDNNQLTPSWDLVAIALVYSVQGLLGLSRLAVSFFFKDELNIQPTELALLTGIALSPWVVKPLYGCCVWYCVWWWWCCCVSCCACCVHNHQCIPHSPQPTLPPPPPFKTLPPPPPHKHSYGFVSDTVPLFGYRRRSYLALCGLLGAASWLTLALGVDNVQGAVLALFLGSISTACSDVVVDSIVVERCRNKPQATAGSLQSLCWTFQSLGGIASAYFSGWAVELYGTRPVFAVTAAFPLLVSLSAFFIIEQRVGGSGGSGSGWEVRQGWDVTNSKKQQQGGGGGVLQKNKGAAAGGVQEMDPTKQLPTNPPTAPTAPTAFASTPTPSTSVQPPTLVQRLQSQTMALWGTIRRKDILLPATFVFLWQATPQADTAMFFFYTQQLGFGPEFLGRVTLASKVCVD